MRVLDGNVPSQNLLVASGSVADADLTQMSVGGGRREEQHPLPIWAFRGSVEVRVDRVPLGVGSDRPDLQPATPRGERIGRVRRPDAYVRFLGLRLSAFAVRQPFKVEPGQREQRVTRRPLLAGIG